MKRIALPLLFTFFGICQTFSQPWQIGHVSTTFTDVDRGNRSIPTEIYYPALTAGDGVAVAGNSGEQFPVITFGHGFFMSWAVYDYFWQTVVPEGYIVAFPTTEMSLLSPSHGDFGDDLAFLVGAIQALGNDSVSLFYDKVSDQSALMGHSMGGGAAILGAENNTGITTTVTLGALDTNPPSVNAASNVTVPSLVIAAGDDCVTPIADHQIPIYSNLASTCKAYVEIADGSHCQFANGNSAACAFGELCSGFVNVQTQHDLVFRAVIPWLDYYLKDACTAWENFETNLETDSTLGLIGFEIACTDTNACPPPVCPQPSGVSVNATCDVATYIWDLETNAIAGQIQHRVHPSEGGGGLGTTVFGPGVTLKNVNGLNEGTTYQSRMRFNCGQGILSPFKFKNFITPTCRTNQGVLSKFSVHQVGEEILINVREGQSEEMALTINAVSGAEMFQTILKQNETYHSVRTSRWAHGIYLVSLKTSVGVKTKKVVLN